MRHALERAKLERQTSEVATVRSLKLVALDPTMRPDDVVHSFALKLRQSFIIVYPT